MDKKENLYTREDLLNLGIYELRDLGRDVGVASPTTLKKQDLVDKILAIIYGEIPKQVVGKGRGRPARAKTKPSKAYISLIESFDEYDNERAFIYPDGENEAVFDEGSFLSSRVASIKTDYVVDDDKKEALDILKTGVVCEENGVYYARKLKFVKTVDDCEIPKSMVRDYALVENDTIEFLKDDTENKIVQIFKINEEIAERKNIVKSKNSDLNNKEIYVEQSKIMVGKSNIVYASTPQDRQRIVDGIASAFESMDYNTIKVCFDRAQSKKQKESSLAKMEIFASYIGDEFETIAMIEDGIEKASLFSTLGRNIVLIVDNLAWLMSVVKTYSSSLYGNLIEKIGMLSKNSNITVVCVTGHLSNETIQELSNYYEHIN